ncbi:MAG: bifunctional hydroxymethylpyrimidine kinase/phosphomethylpyrimidine kinase [Chlorobiaceae bacterium]|nr:bifunctional hydroxymethylpyrimidine kinase/phosphomethylpyrimidine kinase [Chlorobiaceae bacterium]
MKKAYKTVLTIAGSDGSGGAGIQADIKTFSALECYGLSVITALTAQNTKGVTAIYPVAETCVMAQFRSIASDISIDAVKIGMLGTIGMVRTVSALLRELRGNTPIILDSVLGSSGGTILLPFEAIPVLKAELFPLASMITPNLPETALLIDMKYPPATPESIETAAMKLLETGTGSVLIKGGHGEGDNCCDCLLYDNRFFWFSSQKIRTNNTHGTGCTLSSAIAAYMARGETIEAAVSKAKTYINEALRAGATFRLGHGNGPLHHFYRQWS